MGRAPEHAFKPEGRVTAGAIEPRGSRLALAFSDRPVALLGPDGKAERTLDPGAGPWGALAFSPDGKALAGGARDGRIFVADTATGRLVASLPAHGGPVAALALSSDGGLLVAASDAEARVVRVAGGAALFALPASPAEVGAVAVAPAGNRVAVALSDTLVRIVVPDGRPLVTIDDLDMAPLAAAFSPDGRLFAAGCADGVITIRDAATGTRVRKDVRAGGPVGAIAFGPDGTWAVAVGISMNPATRESSAHVVPVRGDGSTAIPLGVLPNAGLGISPDGTAHVVAGGREGARIWDLARSAAG
jgi:WD40 repeat protein